MPKDGTWTALQVDTGSLVVERRFVAVADAVTVFT
jgi:hypothetical protein